MAYHRNPSVVVEPQADYVVFFDAERGLLKKSNRVGLLIWSLCDGTHGEESIADAVRAAYPQAASALVHEDVRTFLRELQLHQFIVPGPGSAT